MTQPSPPWCLYICHYSIPSSYRSPCIATLLTLSTWNQMQTTDGSNFSQILHKFKNSNFQWHIFGYSITKYIQMSTNKPSNSSISLWVTSWISFKSNLCYDYSQKHSIKMQTTNETTNLLFKMKKFCNQIWILFLTPTVAILLWYSSCLHL